MRQEQQQLQQQQQEGDDEGLTEAQIRKLSETFEALDAQLDSKQQQRALASSVAGVAGRRSASTRSSSSIADEKEFDYQLDVSGTQNVHGAHEGVLSPSHSLPVPLLGASTTAGGPGPATGGFQVDPKQIQALGEIHDGDALDVHALQSLSNASAAGHQTDDIERISASGSEYSAGLGDDEAYDEDGQPISQPS